MMAMANQKLLQNLEIQAGIETDLTHGIGIL